MNLIFCFLSIWTVKGFSFILNKFDTNPYSGFLLFLIGIIITLYFAKAYFLNSPDYLLTYIEDNQNSKISKAYNLFIK